MYSCCILQQRSVHIPEIYSGLRQVDSKSGQAFKRGQNYAQESWRYFVQTHFLTDSDSRVHLLITSPFLFWLLCTRTSSIPPDCFVQAQCYKSYFLLGTIETLLAYNACTACVCTCVFTVVSLSESRWLITIVSAPAVMRPESFPVETERLAHCFHHEKVPLE